MTPEQIAKFEQRAKFEERARNEERLSAMSPEDILGNPESSPEDRMFAFKKMKIQSAQKRQSDIEGMGFGESFMVGMGREGDKLKSGIADIYDTMLEKFGSSEISKKASYDRRARAEDQANKDKIFDTISEEHAAATMMGQVAPYLASAPAGLVAAGGRGLLRGGLGMAGREIPKSLAKQAPKEITHLSQKSLAAAKAKEAAAVVGEETLLGALEGAASYDDSALEGSAWGLGGGIAGRYAGRILGGNPVKLGGEDQRIVDFAKKHDQYVPPGMSTGDAAVQQLDGALASHRKTANIVDDALADSYHRQNEYISNEIAQHYDDIPQAEVFSRNWLDDTKASIGNRLDDLTAAGEGIVDDDIALKALDAIDELRLTGVSDDMIKPLNQWSKMFSDLADSGVKINGHEYQMIKDRLRKAAKVQRGQVLIGGGPIADTLDNFSTLFDDAMENGISGANKGAWKQTRRDWALVSAIEKVKKKGKPIRGLSESGHIDARDLAKEFGSSELINNFADLQALRMRQRRSSLSTSALLGRALGGATTGAPTDTMGSLMLMGARAPGGDILKVNEILAKLYMSGVPANTGIAPIFGRTFTEPAFQRGVPRSLMTLGGGPPELEDEQ